MEYTKGEWKAGYNPGVTGPTTPSFQPFCGEDWPYKTINVGEETIAIIPAQDTDKMHKPNLIALQANTNLMVSSPELYEELKQADRVICHLCKRLNPQHKDCISCADREVRLQILAKAEAK